MPPEGDGPAPKTLRIRHTKPIVTINTKALGPLTFRSPTINDAVALEKVDSTDSVGPEVFASELLRVVGRRAAAGAEDEGAALTADDVAALTTDERRAIVAGLLAGMPHLYSEPEKIVETDAEGRQVERRGETKIVLPREDGETDEAYLLRGWRDYWKRMMVPFADLAKKLGEATSGLSDVWKKAVIPDLYANSLASAGLADQIAKMGVNPLKGLDMAGLDPFKGLKGLDLKGFDAIKELKDLSSLTRVTGPGGLTLFEQAARDTKPWELGPKLSPKELIADQIAGLRDFHQLPQPLDDFEIPPNPVLETNELLAKVSDRIDAMATLAGETAAMHQTLNDAAVKILTLFSKGAEASRKAGGRGLRISIITAVLTLLAIVAGVWGVLYEDGQSARRDVVAAHDHASEVKMLGDETTAINRLAMAIASSR